MAKDNLVRSFLGIMAFAVIAIAMKYLSELLIPLTIAAIFTIIFKPLVARLIQKNISMAVALLVVMAVLAFSLYLFGAILYASAKPLIAELPSYQDKLTQVLSGTLNTLTGTAQQLGIHLADINVQTLAGATTTTAETLSNLLETFIHFLSNAGLVLFFMLFMIAGINDLPAKVQLAYSQEQATEINQALLSISSQIRRYMVVKLVANAITGLLTWLILWLIGVKFSAFFGILAFFVCFIPTVGSVVAIGSPAIFALLQFETLLSPLIVIGVLGLVYTVLGSVVEPKFLAATLNLSALLILIALVFWGLIWGPVGMLLAVPLTTIIKIIFEHTPPLKPVSVLMGSKTS